MWLYSSVWFLESKAVARSLLHVKFFPEAIKEKEAMQWSKLEGDMRACELWKRKGREREM